MNSVMAVLIPTFIGVVVGFAAGAIVAILWYERNKEEKPETPSAQPKVVEKVVEKVIEKPVEKLPEGVDRNDFGDLLRFWRRRTDGSLWVEIAGRAFPKAEALEPQQRQLMENLLREGVIWLGLGRPAPATAQPPAAAPQTPAAAPQTPAAVAQPVSVAAVVTPPVVSDRPKSIVEQIDEVVQELLPTSSLAGRNIHVSTDLKEGVVVWDGNQRYVGIGGVSDPVLRAFLQAAVAEWERRSSKT
ncbi:MAG: hypothetical protein KA988_03225 [Longilinea sp.]|nr:hypothetical protein [Longilinea sp.]